MTGRFALAVLVLLLWRAAPAVPAAPAPEAPALTPEEKARCRVRLRLVDIEMRKRLQSYEAQLEYELSLTDSIRALANNPKDRRGPEYERALRETQVSLKETEEKLVALEKERIRLLGRLGRSERDAPDPLGLNKVPPTLETVVERLTEIEKRLERLEHRR
jgi:hypothetical protein